MCSPASSKATAPQARDDMGAQRKAEAQRIVRTQGSLMLLHALYQRWGLPTALLKPLFEGEGSPATMPDERTLCEKCGGNGTVKIPGGISVCDRCKGDCWEPGSELAALRAEVARLREAARVAIAALRDDPLPWQYATARAQHAAEQEAALQRQRAEQAEQDVAELESVLATCRSELVENVREYNEQKARADQAEQQLETAGQRWANERQDLVGRLDRAQRTIDRLTRDAGKR